jgi:hypothetical protein
MPQSVPPLVSSALPQGEAPLVTEQLVPTGLVNVRCSLGKVRVAFNLTLRAPPFTGQKLPVKLLFCVDTIKSMRSGRIEAAKEALLSILAKAEEQITATPDRPISLAIVAFFLVIHIRDAHNVNVKGPDEVIEPGELRPLLKDQRPPSSNNPPFRLEYVSLDGSKPEGLSSITVKISQFFDRQLESKLTIDNVTTSGPWTVEPLQAPVSIAPNQEHRLSLTVTGRASPVLSAVPITVHYKNYQGEPATFQTGLPFTAGDCDAS